MRENRLPRTVEDVLGYHVASEMLVGYAAERNAFHDDRAVIRNHDARVLVRFPGDRNVGGALFCEKVLESPGDDAANVLASLRNLVS